MPEPKTDTLLRTLRFDSDVEWLHVEGRNLDETLLLVTAARKFLDQCTASTASISATSHTTSAADSALAKLTCNQVVLRRGQGLCGISCEAEKPRMAGLTMTAVASKADVVFYSKDFARSQV
jgi:hypothetical protein